VAEEAAFGDALTGLGLERRGGGLVGPSGGNQGVRARSTIVGV